MEISPIQEVKDRLDIVEVIGDYIKLEKSGANFRALCPFHAEKTPSFFVSPSRQTWHCFGACSEGGDIFEFVQRIEGIEFSDALRQLAAKAGVKLTKQDPRLVTERQRLLEISELATQFYEKQLAESKAGKGIAAYLTGRGIEKESLATWRVGHAPDRWQGLLDFLVGRGYKRAEIAKVGLIVTNEKGKTYDRFRNRIMFPVFDISGNVVGFGGRKLETAAQEEPKYINTPNTPLYDKSRVLYGLNRAKVASRKEDVCIVTEGYLDVIMTHQAGTENVVASSGTALTKDHLVLLKRYTNNLTLAFDMDLAGDSATKRGIDLAQQLGFELNVVDMPQGKDPADIVAKEPKDWQTLLENAKDIVQYYFDTALERAGELADLSARDKMKVAAELLPVINRIPNKIGQSHWLQQLSRKLTVDQQSLEEEIKKLKPEKAATTDEKPVVAPHKKTRHDLLEEKLLVCVVRDASALDAVTDDITPLLSHAVREIINFLHKNKSVFEKGGLDEIPTDELAKEHLALLNEAALRADIEVPEDAAEEAALCATEMRNMAVRAELEKVSLELKTAEEADDADKVSKLLERFQELTKQLA